MKFTSPVQIFIILILFISLTWLSMHVHLSSQWMGNKVSSHEASSIVEFDTQLAIQHAREKLEAAKALAGTVVDKKDEGRENEQKLRTTKSLVGETLLIQKDSLQTSNRPKLHTVTYASHHGRDDRFCRSVESAIRYKYELVILGWQIKWRGLSQKLEAAHAYAASIPGNDLMIFTDAFDVLYTAEAEKIVDVFLSRNYTVLFAAECGCWPHVMDDVKICTHQYPVSPTPYRYLNSGTWIGYAKQAKDMLAEVIQLAGQNFGNANDQKLVADMFLAGRHGIKLDYQCEVFQSMHRTDPPPLPLCNPSADLQLSSEKRWFNKRTKTYPAIFHFNGGGKEHHIRMENSVWYKEPSFYQGQHLQSLATSRILVPSNKPVGTLRFDEICPDYLRKLKGGGH